MSERGFLALIPSIIILLLVAIGPSSCSQGNGGVEDKAGKAKKEEKVKEEVSKGGGKMEGRRSGKEIYEMACIGCHGVDGVSVVAGVPSFARGEAAGGRRLDERSNSDLRDSIINGISKPSRPVTPVMPPYGGGRKLSDEEINAVIGYIRGLRR